MLKSGRSSSKVWGISRVPSDQMCSGLVAMEHKTQMTLYTRNDGKLKPSNRTRRTMLAFPSTVVFVPQNRTDWFSRKLAREVDGPSNR